MARATRDLSFAVSTPLMRTRRWNPPSHSLLEMIFVLTMSCRDVLSPLTTCSWGIVRATNIASPSLSIRQAMNCLLRACASQLRGHLLRAIPPDKTANFSANVGEKLIAATEEIFKLEELGELQKELPFILA